MKESIKPVYYCEFCKKHGLSKSQMLKHERFCSQNPANDTICSLCTNCQPISKTFTYNEGTEEEYEAKSNAFFCSAKQVGIYPIKAIKKGLLEKYPTTFKDQIQMPFDCELFKSELDG